MERLNEPLVAPRAASWKWTVCALLFLATMLMYMDRQTLSQMAKRIGDELHLSNTQYGRLEMSFGLAFAAGAIINGLVADRVSIRWLYPVMLMGWSLAGVATAYSVGIGQALTEWIPGLGSGPGASSEEVLSHQAFVGLLACRITLGFFESGHWPCALITTQRILESKDRTFGNSLLQSGASVGAVLTPLAIWVILQRDADDWRGPFVIIGMAGMSWVIPWLLVIRKGDLDRRSETATEEAAAEVLLPEEQAKDRSLFIQRVLVLLAVVIPINMTWQFFRAWLPKMMQEEHLYSEQFVLGFTSAYYLFADAGCIAAGVAVKGLSARGWRPHSARSATFFVCTLLTMLSVLAASLQAGWVLLAILLLIGAGSLGMFPIYYSLTQEISKKHLGIASGLLGAMTWVIGSLMQEWVGRSVDATQSYSQAIFWIGQAPIVACIALVFFWGRSRRE